MSRRALAVVVTLLAGILVGCAGPADTAGRSASATAPSTPTPTTSEIRHEKAEAVDEELRDEAAASAIPLVQQVNQPFTGRSPRDLSCGTPVDLLAGVDRPARPTHPGAVLTLAATRATVGCKWLKSTTSARSAPNSSARTRCTCAAG
jgi:hypothetical protein